MAPQNYNPPTTTDTKCAKNKTSSDIQYGKFDIKSNKCKSCIKKEACCYYNLEAGQIKAPKEYSKKLTDINIYVYFIILALSLFGWFIKGSVPTEILTAATSAYSLIMLFYFGKSGSENVTKIKNSYECYTQSMPGNILAGDTALTNVSTGSTYNNVQEDDLINILDSLNSEEDIENVDVSLLESLMQAELDKAEPLIVNDSNTSSVSSSDDTYDNRKYSNLTGY